MSQKFCDTRYKHNESFSTKNGHGGKWLFFAIIHTNTDRKTLADFCNGTNYISLEG